MANVRASLFGPTALFSFIQVWMVTMVITMNQRKLTWHPILQRTSFEPSVLI